MSMSDIADIKIDVHAHLCFSLLWPLFTVVTQLNQCSHCHSGRSGYWSPKGGQSCKRKINIHLDKQQLTKNETVKYYSSDTHLQQKSTTPKLLNSTMDF
jgi:hypothetical protein